MLLITKCGELLTMDPSLHRDGDDRALGRIPEGAVCIEDGRVVWVGGTDEVPTDLAARATETIDAGGRAVIPGMIDCHTHVVYGGSRDLDFARRTSGMSYEEIAALGGGIRLTVDATRRASLDELVEAALPRLDKFLATGVTTVEVKSGYGLTFDDELKMLRAVAALDEQHPIDLVPTFLGAHIVPPEHRDDRETYIAMLVDELMPRVREEGLAQFCDVFCDTPAYSLEETERILGAAKELGFGLKLHAEQLATTGATRLGARMGAVSVDHLEAIGPAEIEALAGTDTVAVLLPGATFFLGMETYPPARALLDAGVAVAVSTDCNPGSSPTVNLPLMTTIACIKAGMGAAEAAVGVTRSAARALAATDRGHLAPGALGDVTILDGDTHVRLAYPFGWGRAYRVIKGGKVVYTATDERTTREHP